MTQHTQDIKQFTVANPNTFDGDSFEVAERAIRQSKAVADILTATLKGARVMARNAEMERQLIATDACDAAAFEDTAQARKIDVLIKNAEASAATLETLARAAGFNPRKAR